MVPPKKRSAKGKSSRGRKTAARKRSPTKVLKPSQEQKAFFIDARIPRGDYPPHTERGGKWLLFIPREDIDEVWQKVCAALAKGTLGDSAKVSTRRSNPNAADAEKHVICVYTYDSDDREDVLRVRASLREIGFVRPIAYKTDQATYEGQYEVTGHRRISKYYE